MPQSKSSAPRSQTAASPIPVVRDEFPRRNEADEFNPDAPAGAEEPSAPTYEIEDEQEERMNERIDDNTRVSRASIDNLKDTIGGGTVINERLRGSNKWSKPYQREKELDEMPFD